MTREDFFKIKVGNVLYENDTNAFFGTGKVLVTAVSGTGRLIYLMHLDSGKVAFCTCECCDTLSFVSDELKVAKKSGEPFKSGNKINTVTGIAVNHYTEGKRAFTFVEDDSCVNIEMCVCVE